MIGCPADDRRVRFGGVRLVVDDDSEIGGEAGKPGVPALPYRPEFPCPITAVDLAEDECRLGAGVGDVVSHDWFSCAVQHDQA